MVEETFDKSRIINFTDAVFSIAMTLLVLEISVPSYQTIKENGTLNALLELTPNFLGLIISFFVIALYWISHLRTMKYVSVITKRMLWLNLFLLFFIVLLPFSTALYVNAGSVTSTFFFYCLNIIFLGIFNYLLIKVAFSKGANDPKTELIANLEKAKALNTLVVWCLAAALAFQFPVFSKLIFLMIFVMEFWLNKRFKKNMKKLDLVD